MKAEILDFKGPASEGSIVDFENKIGHHLPSDYRFFLGKYNGGYPEPDAFHFLNSEDGSSVDRFLSLGNDKDNDLLDYFNKYKDRMPSGFIPIAHDPGGNLIIIKVGEAISEVFFWDHEQEADEGEIPSMRNIYIISKSFTNFLSELYALDI